jgi:hypothetical protein
MGSASVVIAFRSHIQEVDVMRNLVWIAPAIAVVCISCAGGGDEFAKPEIVKSADIVREDDGVTSRYFDVNNPYTQERIAEVREDEGVRATVEGFERNEYTYEPERSFVAEGEGPDGKRLEVAALTMTRVAERSTEVVYVLSLRGEDAAYVVPVKFSFADCPGDDDACRISEGVWMALTGEPAGPDARLSAEQLSWRAWFRCLVERIVAGAASCAWTCRFAPGLYWPCLAECTAGYVIYAIFSCSFQQM